MSRESVRRRIVGVLAVVGALAVITVLGAMVVAWISIQRGFSARDEPTALESSVALGMRKLAVPARIKALSNPEANDEAGFIEARAHFADHCAQCHANDGSGRTEIGRSVYPRAPDMRGAATQGKTDGELYAIIQNGIRLTAMPAWGDAHDEKNRASWQLVHFIRRLPTLSPADLAVMRGLNPRSAAEWAEEQHEKDFLDGKSANAQPEKPHHH